MNLVARLRPAVPVAVALVGVLVTLAVASRVLPGRVVMVHLSETGGSAFAASRGDLVLLGAVLVVGIVVTWLISALFLAVTPVRHVLVPHAAFWKKPPNRAEMRRRYARYLAVATSASLWFVAALFVLALVSQSGPLAAWWLPAAVSTAYVLFVLGGLVWVFTAGFTPTPTGVSARAAASDQEARVASGPSASVVETTRSGPSAVRPPRASPRPTAETPRTGTAPPAPSSRPGRAPGRPQTPTGDGPRTGPPRPYQPRPRSGGPRG
ncbi:hypothetical protein [Frigoribacterium sp. MCBA15_019]|uniref:hypothetical protein n=1 Tax=Frigoribacterium sp. MCBA15_019 TaxID=1898745 RepID=UPI0008DEA6BE|nr:hypothetical protein [Frigoribacterium sp. MCBA15_019]OII22409.1 hypothetical protein BIV04_08635 [Frigoribacterium sp. MCBA15_019]